LVDISLQKTVKTATRVGGRTEPDLDLIKQVEQVTTSDLEGPAWRFAGIPSVGITHAVEVLVFSDFAIPELAIIWLQKQPGMAEDDHLRSGRRVAEALRHAARQTESLPACDTGDHRLAAITLSHVRCYVPRNTTRASTAFTP
jgi:hypothetical protein